MSRKGGYKIIDLKGFDFKVNENETIINGIYEEIESNYNKPILLSGIVINGIEKNDIFLNPYVDDGLYIFSCYDVEIVVGDDDIITIRDRIIDIYANDLTPINNGKYRVHTDSGYISINFGRRLVILSGFQTTNMIDSATGDNFMGNNMYVFTGDVDLKVTKDVVFICASRIDI